MRKIPRRSILQALLSLPALPLAKRPPAQAAPAAILYTDSAGRTHAQLVPLSDGNTKTGGISYNA